MKSPLHPGIAADANLMIELVKQDIPITKETRLLEVGCGTGILTFHLDRVCTVHGIDSSPALLALNPVDNTSVMDVQHLNFDDETFDVVFEHDMLRRTPDMNLALQEMKRVSKKYIVVAEPNILNLANLLSSVLVPSEWKARRFTRVAFEGIVARNGLRILRARTYGVFIPWLTLKVMVPLAREFSFDQPFGLEHLFVAEKL